MTNKAEVCGWQPKGNSEDIPKPPKFNTDKLSVEKLQEQLNTAKRALTEITKIPESDNYFDCEECIVMMEESAKQALEAIGGDDETSN